MEPNAVSLADAADVVDRVDGGGRGGAHGGADEERQSTFGNVGFDSALENVGAHGITMIDLNQAQLLCSYAGNLYRLRDR